MEIDILKSLVKRFNNEKTIENWILLENHIDDKHSCKECGGPIFYDNSRIRLSRSGVLKYDPIFTSCKTHKKIGDNIYYLKVCQKCVTDKFPEYLKMNRSRVFNGMNKITKYAFEITEDDFIKSKKLNAVTLENLTRKYGEAEALIRWKKYINLQAITNSFEYKKQKYGWSEEDFRNFNISRGVTLKNLIKKYGEKIGSEVFNSYVEKQRVNGKTLDYFIEKLGDNEGRIKYKEISVKKAKGGIASNVSYSKVSQDFFNRIDESISKYYNTSYASKNSETIIFIDKISKCYLLDYYIEEIKVCIEFNGDYYHANPKKYNPDFEFPEFFSAGLITSKDIWERDEKKKNLLWEEMGIKTIIVWESDYYKNKENEDFYRKIIKQCIEK